MGMSIASLVDFRSKQNYYIPLNQLQYFPAFRYVYYCSQLCLLTLCACYYPPTSFPSQSYVMCVITLQYTHCVW